MSGLAQAAGRRLQHDSERRHRAGEFGIGGDRERRNAPSLSEVAHVAREADHIGPGQGGGGVFQQQQGGIHGQRTAQAHTKTRGRIQIANALFQMLVTQGLLEGGTEIVLVPENRSLQADLLAADPMQPRPVAPPPPMPSAMG